MHGLVFWLFDSDVASEQIVLSKDTANTSLRFELEFREGHPSNSPIVAPSENFTIKPPDDVDSIQPLIQKEIAPVPIERNLVLSRQRTKPESDYPSAPVLTVGIEPGYPLPLFLKGVAGSVTATFRVGKGGIFESIQVIESSPAGVFDKAVIEAIGVARILESSAPLGRELMITITFDPAGTGAQPQLVKRP